MTCRQLPGRTPKLNLQTTCVATPVKPPSAKVAKRSKVEIVKEKSDFLRHPLMEELVNENSYINEDAVQLMKFHGSYQQDHREKRAFGNGKFYQFMMRTRQPGGVVPNQLYLTMDDLSEQVRQSELLRDNTRLMQVAKTAQSGARLFADNPCHIAVWQRHTTSDHQADIPVAWSSQARLEDSVFFCHQEHGVNFSSMW